MNRYWWLRPMMLFGLVSVVSVLLTQLPSPWADWARDGCDIVDCYCENFDAGFVAQLINTYSNLPFVLVGLLVLFAPPPFVLHARLYGLIALAMGFNSGFYHASLTRAGEWLDLVGVYAFSGWLLLYNFSRWRVCAGRSPLTQRQFVGLLLIIVALGGVQMTLAREAQQLVFGGLVAGAVIFEALIWRCERPPAQARYLAAGMGCFAVGAALWFVPCLLPIPAHAVWHTLAAVAAGLMFVYYRSEL